MTTFGKNLKLVVAEDHRSKIRSLFTEVFGATTKSPAPHIDIHTLEDGFNIGVFFVEESLALSVADQHKGAWLELLVSDVSTTQRRLGELSVASVPYEDKTHSYFQIPGGPVFRLAPKV